MGLPFSRGTALPFHANDARTGPRSSGKNAPRQEWSKTATSQNRWRKKKNGRSGDRRLEEMERALSGGLDDAGGGNELDLFHQKRSGFLQGVAGGRMGMADAHRPAVDPGGLD